MLIDYTALVVIWSQKNTMDKLLFTHSTGKKGYLTGAQSVPRKRLTRGGNYDFLGRYLNGSG